MSIKLYDKKNECCGCTACMNICQKHAIKMKSDEEGFLYPEIDKDKCIECGLCKKVCAFQNGYTTDNSLKEIEVYATKNKSDEVRKHSSSGGMFYSIAEYVLNNNGIVYGVVFDEDFHASHTRTDDMNGIEKMMGSKYSQSNLGKIYDEVKKDLQEEKIVLFTGTPCQVAGLNRFLYDVDKSNLILVDIICHGTPSPKLFHEYIEFLEKKRKRKIKNYYHRSKIKGWNHTEAILYVGDKLDYKSRISQTWKRIFYTDLALRPSCYSCKYTNINRPGDITIADFWGIQLYDKEFADDKGVSLTIINTSKGEKIFKEIKNNLEISERKIDEAINKNPQLKQPIHIDENNRKSFWNDYELKGFNYIAKKYGGYNNIGKLKNLVKIIVKK